MNCADLGRLAGLPRAHFFEAPSSWLTRAALSQGVRPIELLEFMGFTRAQLLGDIDVLLMSSNGRRVLATAGNLARFPVAERVLANLPHVGTARDLLLHDAKGRACFTFCPQCLREQREPHLEIHHRFVSWGFCPLHRCLIEDACANCGQSLVLPFDMLRAGRRGEGVAYLRHCQNCQWDLGCQSPFFMNDLAVARDDLIRLKNGRALMAALYYGKAKTTQSIKEASLRKTRLLIRATIFTSEVAWIRLRSSVESS